MKVSEPLTKKQKIERMNQIVARFLSTLGVLRSKRRRIVERVLRSRDEQKVQTIINSLKRQLR